VAQPNIIPDNESDRISAVRRYEILDTPPDGAFDRITALAARRFGVPIAIVSIVDTDRIWFKSHHGLAVDEIGRDPGLCASAILAPAPHIVIDALADPRTLANPLVAGDFGLRFYAGVPLRTSDGFNLGTLCVIDTESRPITQSQIDDLQDLASVVMDQMELRLSARTALARAAIMAREIDHRVMNSLQFISGLLALQSRQPNLDDPAAELRAASQRVAAIARVHKNFYMAEAEDTVPCRAFLVGLCQDLTQILGKPVNAHVDDRCSLSTSKISAIGLIVNELVTNAAKHGQGVIDVHFEIEDQHNIVRVCDEGPGLRSDFDFRDAKHGLGVKIVTTLAAQLSGEVQVAPYGQGAGICISVRFPI
jgi:two-component sensor histidine kinase